MPRSATPRFGMLALLLVGIAVAVTKVPNAPSLAADAKKVEPPFKVPAGFVVEIVASAPLVDHPLMACFDDRGRLFVAESAGQNLKAEQLLTQLPNSIRLLEDTQGTGVFDKSTVFADKMTFPMGVLWHNGALFSCSPPSLWKLEDTTGKGVADKRQEIVTKFGFIGNAADIHGPFLGPDGRFYWTDGRHGHQIATREGKELRGQAARIFRCRPDGRDVEVVCGGGMDDPVEMAFTAEGEAFATVDIFIAKPARNDAIIHCIEGGVFPYHPVYREFKSTGDLLPPVTYLGWVAPSGLMRYRGTALGKDYRDNLFSTLFNTHKVQRHILERDGATFRAKNEDFLIAASPDFHPTDVLEDADGSLLVLDTGGWFRIGCPTSQLAKPDVKGAIYRVRRTDAPRGDDPWGRKLGWDKLTSRELGSLLDDPRWPVRDGAVERLAGRGTDALPVLKELLASSHPVRARRNAVWALCRMDIPEARAITRGALKDADPSVRNAAAHAVGLHRDGEASSALTAFVVKDDAPAVRREAATALGRIRQGASVPALLEALGLPGDRFLEHALIFSLIEIADREATLKGLGNSNPKVRRGALIALDQMAGGKLTRELVVPLLDTDDLPLQQTVLTTVMTRPDWAPQVVDFLRGWLARSDLPANRQEILRSALVSLAKDRAIQDLVVQALQQEQTPIPTRLLALEAIAQAPLEKLPPSWLTELGRSVEHADERVAHQAINTVRARTVKELDDALRRVAGDKSRPAGLRVAALGAVAPRLKQVDGELFAFVLGRLNPDLPPLDRLSAAAALGQAPLSDAQLVQLAGAVKTAGALEMPHLIAPFERSTDPQAGRKFLAALDKSPGLTSLSPDVLQRTFKGYPEDVRAAVKPFLEKLELNLEQQKKRLAELAPVLLGGDARQGRAVFYGAKAACATCHMVKKEGGEIGPDLSAIGGIRTGRDLLESIVFPSASFVRGYEPYVVATKDGRLVNGILKRETADALYVVTAERTEVRIPRSAIDSLDPGKVSIMPQGLDTQLSRQELADLISWLMSLK
ncbi:hypothetical protein AYO44_01265 [Planctomycetaceae bacterium SCGC AG-212-F19]|nr:hypothetical protein AYO44_01265 [Planctomycetaceae bacterium SCGC AG-212-F19]